MAHTQARYNKYENVTPAKPLARDFDYAFIQVIAPPAWIYYLGRGPVDLRALGSSHSFTELYPLTNEANARFAQEIIITTASNGGSRNKR